MCKPKRPYHGEDINWMAVIIFAAAPILVLATKWAEWAFGVSIIDRIP